MWEIHFLFSFGFLDRISLYSFGWPGAGCEDQFIKIPLPLPPRAGMKGTDYAHCEAHFLGVDEGVG